MAVSPIPTGFHTVTPYLLVNGAEKLIQFTIAAFNAKELNRTVLPGGMIMHAQIKIGDSIIMLADARAECPAMPSAIHIYVPNIDEVYARAIAAGGRSIMEPKDQFYGDRNAGVKDSTGNIWWIATQVEEVSSKEAQQRLTERLAQEE